MEPRVWVKSLTFSDNTTITFGKDDVVIIVGPNNCGKSATLRAIREKLQSPATQSPVVQSVGVGGGKDRVPVVARSLRALEVPLAIIVDFDVLSNEERFAR